MKKRQLMTMLMRASGRRGVCVIDDTGNERHAACDMFKIDFCGGRQKLPFHYYFTSLQHFCVSLLVDNTWSGRYPKANERLCAIGFVVLGMVDWWDGGFGWSKMP